MWWKGNRPVPSPLQIIAFVIWVVAEKLDISLGCLAPYIFGLMIGHWPRKVKDAPNE